MYSTHTIISRVLLLVLMSLAVPACDSSDRIRPIDMFSISGKITSSAVGVANIVVSAGTRQEITDVNGNYKFTDLPSGRYTIRPTESDLEFTPDTLEVTLNGYNVKDQDFIAYKRGSRLFSVSGKITGDGIDVSDIIVTDGIHFDTTDKLGYYGFSGLPKGMYTIKLKRSDLKFTPDSIPASIVDRELTNRDFTAHSIFEMVNISGGTYVMGSDNNATNEKPAHSVTVSSFQIGKYELTQLQWYRIMGTKPSTFHNDNNPIENVSWYDAVTFCNKLSKMQGLRPSYVIDKYNTTCDFTADGYRLPTEAEWEYACRAGTTTDRYSGNVSRSTGTYFKEPNLDTIAWYRDHDPTTSKDSAHPVGLKSPNTFGLYDMMGNVTEWCWDYWSANNSSPYAVSASPQINPRGPSTADNHALRGGSWFDMPKEVRSAFHRQYDPAVTFSGVGFRISRSLP
ncbi:MAG: serine/threonine kinase [Chlorobi bacterium]|nr:serine/threonine kinase [Chlorobiota bacterium]